MVQDRNDLNSLAVATNLDSRESILQVQEERPYISLCPVARIWSRSQVINPSENNIVANRGESGEIIPIAGNRATS